MNKVNLRIVAKLNILSDIRVRRDLSHLSFLLQDILPRESPSIEFIEFRFG